MWKIISKIFISFIGLIIGLIILYFWIAGMCWAGTCAILSDGLLDGFINFIIFVGIILGGAAGLLLCAYPLIKIWCKK